MKHIFFKVLLVGATLVMLECCKKDSVSPIYGNDPSIFQQYPVIIDNLVAGRWIKNDRGIYVDTFQNIIPFPITGNHSVKIYMVSNHQETLINNGIPFMNGKLWASYTNGIIELDFLPENRIFPFSYLIIKVVIE